MYMLFNTPINSQILITLTAIYFVAAAVTTFDIRLIQAKRRGDIPADAPLLPRWTAVFIFLMWGTWIFVLFLNWRYAIFLFVAKFVLKVLPVLETIGNILMSPFKNKGYRGRL